MLIQLCIYGEAAALTRTHLHTEQFGTMHAHLTLEVVADTGRDVTDSIHDPPDAQLCEALGSLVVANEQGELVVELNAWPVTLSCRAGLLGLHQVRMDHKKKDA